MVVQCSNLVNIALEMESQLRLFYFLHMHNFILISKLPVNSFTVILNMGCKLQLKSQIFLYFPFYLWLLYQECHPGVKVPEFHFST